MFQFTTTNVINSSVDLTSGKPLWSFQAAKENKPASLNVKRVNNFISDNVSAIYKAVAHDGELAKVSMDLSQINGKKGDQLCLSIYLGLSQGSHDSRYSNDLVLKGKPLSVDFVFGDTVEETIDKLVKTIKKYQLMIYGEKLLNIEGNGSYIVIEATNEYQRFRKVNIEKLDASANFNMGEFEVVYSLADLDEKETNAEVTDSAEGFFKGKEGFGTYSWLLHNLRIPTEMRTRTFATNQDETPVLGAKYNQYTIHYCVNRGVLGTNAVGDMVTSSTVHVFYVKSDLASDFESALEQLGTVTEVKPKA